MSNLLSPFIPYWESITDLEKQYLTGEEPVLVLCSDMNQYVCKYMRTSKPSFKLVNELVGSIFAEVWGIPTPGIALIKIKEAHWKHLHLPHVHNVPSLGSRYMQQVADLSPSSFNEIVVSKATLKDIMEIALFDIWIANEDRNINNFNLMYRLDTKQIIAIDFGCIFNTGTYDFFLTQLTATDTILYSDLFHFISKNFKITFIEQNILDLKQEYMLNIEKSKKIISQFKRLVPVEWNVPFQMIEDKVFQLFDKGWINSTWDNFRENVYDNLR